MKQRGFSLIVYAVLALAVLGALSGIAWKIRESGKDVIRLEWAEANRRAEEAERAARLRREETGRAASAALQKAETEARIYETRWKEARREQSRRFPLAVCPEGPAVAPRAEEPGHIAAVPESAPGAILADRGPLLTPSFVMLYDGAWTDATGQPIWPYPRGSSKGTTSAAPVEPGHVLDTHAENAFRCSENARRQKALIDLIKRLRSDADEKSR